MTAAIIGCRIEGRILAAANELPQLITDDAFEMRLRSEEISIEIIFDVGVGLEK